MLPATRRRVEQNTGENINRMHRQEIEDSLRYHRSRPVEISARLRELDHEWSLERTLETHTAAAAAASVLLATLVNRKFLILTAAVAAVTMQHAITGWCPRTAVLRRLGFRNAAEICEERCRLQVLQAEDRMFSEPAPTQWRVEAEQIHEAVEA